MGTNFFAKRRMPSNDELARFIREKEIEGTNAAEPLRETLNKLSERIHICKRSVGWHILYDHNRGVYWKDATRKSIDDFISSNDMFIVDEYGTEYTTEDFWREMDEWEEADGLLDSKAYIQKQKTALTLPSEDIEHYISQCPEPIRGYMEFGGHSDFWHDGMRWSIASDFR